MAPAAEQAGLVLAVDVGDLALEDDLRALARTASTPTSSFLAALIVACTDRGGNRLASRSRSRMT